ncbi:MAG: hypothetical protein J6T26_09960 [Firmicutes bacterium]|nr:hypothetical protein [Bacillota bacterium]
MDSKIPHQSADWIRDDKAGRPQRPSEVFLELWQWRALDQSPEKFAECAAAWRQIVSLEEVYAEAERRQALEDFWEIHPAWSPIMSAPTAPGPVTCEAEDTSSGAAAPPSPQGEGLTYDCASAPMTEEAEEAEAKAREAANRSAGAKAGFATRKRNLTERLEDLRRRGVKMHEIAAAVNGLTITDVMDALQAKAMSPMKIQALEKAARKLEEADAGGGEDS